MKVLNLACAFGHAFEGWFDSEDEMVGQLLADKLECPVCCDRRISRRPTAPNLHLRRAGQPEAVRLDAEGQGDVVPDASGEQAARQLRSAWLALGHHLAQQAEDVGQRFADEARSMHRGELPSRPIKGLATAQEAVALTREGIPVLPLPVIDPDGGPLH